MYETARYPREMSQAAEIFHGPHGVGPDVENSFVPRLRADLQLLEVEGDVLVIDPGLGQLHLLDRLSAAIWPLLDGTATITELVEDLSAGFDTPAHVVREDLSTLVRALRRRELLDDSQPSGPSAFEPPMAGEGYGYLVDPPAP